MSDLIPRIKERAAHHYDQVLALRRHIHANPELSFEEYETAKFLEDKLLEFGFKDVTRIGKTGVTFLIHGREKGRTIALRADIDALPITEENNVPYRSQNPGVMHACGHDVHTASLLGACLILNDLQDHFNGTVKIIFQPGEEKTPGGASILIKEGILENPVPDKILGQHVMPLIPEGKVGFRSGEYMASADEVYLTIRGKGGHAAMPESTIDPILVTSHIILALQQVVSRRANPKMPSVLSFGYVEGAGATNVIPNEVKLMGTFRTFDEKWRFEAHRLIIEMATGIAQSMGAECDAEVEVGYPFLANDPDYTKANIKAAQAYLGEENVLELDRWMAGEDFAFYSHHLPACFYRLGTRNEAKGIISGVHTPTFDIDEKALCTGMGLMAWLAISELNQ